MKKTFKEIRQIIDSEGMREIYFVRYDKEKKYLIYKFNSFVHMYTLEKLRKTLLKYNYGYIITKKDITIFSFSPEIIQ